MNINKSPIQKSPSTIGAEIYIPRSKRITKKECLETKRYRLTPNEIKFDDEGLKSTQSIIDINFTEFAPEVFRQLRELEEIYEDEMIE